MKFDSMKQCVPLALVVTGISTIFIANIFSVKPSEYIFAVPAAFLVSLTICYLFSQYRVK